jgi:hypothetical protein
MAIESYYYHEDENYYYYTKVNKYEIQKGVFEKFYTSSPEFVKRNYHYQHHIHYHHDLQQQVNQDSEHLSMYLGLLLY